MTNAFSISTSVAARNPDVLTCLANLSNDEVFTPPNVVDRLLDLLPSELFRNPATTFLDPACKSGVFLREIAKRLVVGLEDAIPDFDERANNIGTELPDDNLNTFCGQNEICTETYVVIGSDLGLTEETVQNLSKYLQTKFVRFCHCLAKSSQDATSKTYRFVPTQDFSKPWTDEELYAKYQLTDDEIAFIESMIRPMSFEDDAPDSAKKAKRKKSPKKS